MDRLSPRQLEIVRLRCEDELTYQEIAVRLGCHFQTVKSHMQDIFRRWDVVSTGGLCYRLYRYGLPPDVRVEAQRPESV